MHLRDNSGKAIYYSNEGEERLVKFSVYDSEVIEELLELEEEAAYEREILVNTLNGMALIYNFTTKS